RGAKGKFPSLVLHFTDILEGLIKTCMLWYRAVQEKVRDVRHIIIHTQSDFIEKTKVCPKIVGGIGLPCKGIGGGTRWGRPGRECPIIWIVPSCAYWSILGIIAYLVIARLSPTVA